MRGTVLPMNNEIEGRRVLVVGAGKSGTAAARVLAREGARVTITDRRPEEELGGSIAALSEGGISWRLGEHRDADFAEADLIVVSPGVPQNLKPLAEAVRRGIPVVGELELGFRLFRAPVYAVTGSSGKSTTTSLMGEMLKAAGQTIFVGGNLGTPLCEAVLSETPWDAAVVEVSSFQLETIRTFRPKISAFLNISPNHLDRYGGMEAYLSAKRRLFENQTAEDFAVLNAAQPVVVECLHTLRARPVLFGIGEPIEGGVWAAEGGVWSGIGGKTTPLMDISEIRLPGLHNVENVLAAAAVALLAGANDSDCRGAVRRFEGLPHRLERVRSTGGIVFYNDSKATTVEAMIRSIQSFDAPVVLIAGGRAKGGDFSLLGRLPEGRLRAAVLIGEAKGLIQGAVKGTIRVSEAATIVDAVHQAKSLARPGDVVLLAPGCASFDMFPNFEVRGEAFKEAVRGL